MTKGLVKYLLQGNRKDPESDFTFQGGQNVTNGPQDVAETQFKVYCATLGLNCIFMTAILIVTRLIQLIATIRVLIEA